MDIFPKPNMAGFRCPVCLTKAMQPVILVAIPGTERDRMIEAKQVHKECYDLVERMVDKEREDVIRAYE